MWLPTAGVTLSLLLPVATFLVASLLLGWRLEVVQTGSMEPIYPVDSLVVVRPINPSDIRVGTPIAFDPEDGRELVTHRVVQVLESSSGLAFRTQGDANANPDPQPVPARQVRGRATWAVPQLGRLVQWLEWPRGFVLLVVLPATALVVTELRARRPERAPVPA
jgi:signal peptidase